jgi:hypothetical protein
MTEGAWLITKLPLDMLREYPIAWNERKVRLFWCACLRRVWDLVTDERTRRVVELVENMSEGMGDALRSEIEAVRRHFARDNLGTFTRHPDCFPYDPDYWKLGLYVQTPPAPLLALVARAAEHVVGSAIPRSDHVKRLVSWFKLRDDAEAAERARQAELIREVFGNPFRRVDVSPWLTSDVLALARGIYDDRAFDRMPILADALQDAGCDNVNVLDHCREPGEHVRGCWVVDLLLGKG